MASKFCRVLCIVLAVIVSTKAFTPVHLAPPKTRARILMTAEGKDHTDNKFHKAAAAFALGLGLFVGGSNCANSAVLSNTPIKDPTLSIVKDEKELNLALKRVWDGETRDETFVVHNDFSWVLATYPVGLLVRKYYLDQMRQEEAAEDTAIDPDCADCNNRLEVACPACDGRGFFMVAEAGGVGGGRGKPAQLPRTCVMCEGTGGVPCPACELAKNQAKYQTKEEDPTRGYRQRQLVPRRGRREGARDKFSDRF